MTTGFPESGNGSVTALPVFVCSVIVPATLLGGAGGLGGSGFFTVNEGIVSLVVMVETDTFAVVCAVVGGTATVGGDVAAGGAFGGAGTTVLTL